MVTRAPIVPLIIYSLVACMGYWSTGSETPDIIINRGVGPKMSDTLMQLGKSCKKFRKLKMQFLIFIVLLLSLLVGITLRT